MKIKGGIEVTGRRGRKRRKLLDDLKERRGYSHLMEEALDRIMWRARFGRGLGPVVRQTTKWMKCQMNNFRKVPASQMQMWQTNEIKYCHNSTMTVHVASLWYRFLNLKHITLFPESTSTVHAMLTASRVCYLLALGEFQIGLCRPIWNMIR
jgi:hypothetical protein